MRAYGTKKQQGLLCHTLPPLEVPLCNLSNPQVHQYHQFNNGHFQPIFHVSDTETERSIGEIIIPMTTFRTTRQRISDDQILDASQLQT